MALRAAFATTSGGTIIELVENGVDLSVWQSAALVPKEPNNKVHFVFVGRLVDWKAVDLLLEAFVPVAAQTGAVLEIIGDGVLRGGLVLPSLLECGGAVVLEAMAIGLPVIATNWGGPADYVDSARLGA